MGLIRPGRWPEMYYRHGRYEPFRLDTVFTDAKERARLMAMAGSLTKAMAASDAPDRRGSRSHDRDLSCPPRICGAGQSDL